MKRLDQFPDLTEKAKEKFSKDRYAREVTGIEIIDVRPNHAICCLKIEDKHKNLVGHVMGGVIFTLADYTFGVAANTDDRLTVTASANIDYLSTPKGEYLVAETKMRKKGSRLSFYEVMVRDENRNKIAEIQIVGCHVDNPTEKEKKELPVY